MNPFSIIPAVTIVLLSLCTVSLLNRRFALQPPAGARYVAIDGLRGYLAFFVFLHHSAVWYCQLKYHQWMHPPSWLYNHFGPTSVFYFFMITAFLFTTKLINAQQKGINWKQLYLSRLFRIMPLYLFALFLLFIIIAILSHFTLQQPWWKVVTQLLGWVGFMSPDINGVGQTWKITAGVIWSLSYEWLFYCTLPFLWMLLFRKLVNRKVLLPAGIALAGFILIVYFFYRHRAFPNLSPFAAGIATAFLVRNNKIQHAVKSLYASMLIPVLLFIMVLFYRDSFSPVPYVFNWLIFILIAGGNTLFGLLSMNASFLLGQISYSIYLLHGMLLYCVFHFTPGIREFAMQSAAVYWLTIALISILLIILCTFTYYYIEQPGISATPNVRAKTKTNAPQSFPRPEVSN
jgi:peptidoglycan/LPS O-acetylase OafA/YrhL